MSTLPWLAFANNSELARCRANLSRVRSASDLSNTAILLQACLGRGSSNGRMGAIIALT